MFRRKNQWESPYVEKRNRKNRRQNHRDQFGIYDSPVKEKRKKKKKNKPFSIKNVVKGVITCWILIIITYIVSFGVKYSMFDKAMTEYIEQDYDNAKPLFEEALKPHLPLLEFFDNNVRLYLADCNVNLGLYGDACCEYNQIKLWKRKDMVGLDYLSNVAYGLQLYAWGNYREALPILAQAYEDGYSDLVLYVGNCYGQTGDLANMQLYYDIFLKSNEMNSFMYAQYAAISLDKGDFEQALDYIEKGKMLQDQSNRRELLFDEIVYYEKLKDYNTAYEKAKSFLEEFPNDVDGKNEYDLLYTRQDVEE